MPFTAYILKAVRVALEYGMLLWLLWFVVRLSHRIFGSRFRMRFPWGAARTTIS